MDAAALRILLSIFILHILFPAVETVKSGSLSGRTKFFRTVDKDNPEFLLVSLPQQRKVSYMQLKDFKAVGGEVLPLIDGALSVPYGIAWDAPRSALYICDEGAKKIYRQELETFKCEKSCKGVPYHLKTAGSRYIVVEGVSSQWVTVDDKGNLFFSDADSNSVNKLTVEVIDMLIKDKLLPSDLKKTSEAVAASEEAAREGYFELLPVKSQTTPAPRYYQLYEKKVSPNVGMPAGVAVGGVGGRQVYWTNQQGGHLSGSVSSGEASPRVKQAAQDEDGPSFPSHMVTNRTTSAYGVAVTDRNIYFTDANKVVWSTAIRTGETSKLQSYLAEPRGIVWDRDNTIYVADKGANNIVSMPVGGLKGEAKASLVADVHAPFAVAFISGSDPIWEKWGAFKTLKDREGLSTNSKELLTLFAAAIGLLLCFAAALTMRGRRGSSMKSAKFDAAAPRFAHEEEKVETKTGFAIFFPKGTGIAPGAPMWVFSDDSDSSVGDDSQKATVEETAKALKGKPVKLRGHRYTMQAMDKGVDTYTMRATEKGDEHRIYVQSKT